MSTPNGSGGTRSERAGQRRMRRRMLIAGGVLGAIVLVAGLAVVFTRGAAQREAERKAAAAEQATGPESKLTMFAVNADPGFAAVVGTGGGRPPSVLAVPTNTLIVLPKERSGTVGDAIAGGGDVGRTAVSNLIGAWIDHYVVLDLQGLTEMVDARGGLTVDLPPGAQVGDKIMGPGPTKMNGEEVTTYLNGAPGIERAMRWRDILVPLFASGKVDLHGTSPVQTDDEQAVDDALNAARGATVTELPTQEIEGRLEQASQEEMVPLLADMFGLPNRLPYDVIILNGTPHLTAERNMTASLVPAGYRVVAYSPAKTDRHKTTFIVAARDEAVPQATEIQKTLGVGRVFLGGEPSGLADVTVVIGKDYLRT